MKRSTAALAAIAGLLAFAAPAVAGEAPPADTSAAPTTSTPATTTSTPPATTSTEPPATTSSEPPATTSTVPATTTTTVPATTTATVPATTTTTTVPTTTDPTGDPCLVDCIPTESDCVGVDCVPIGGAGGVPTALGAGSLPFTGIGDMIAPILMALVVLIGGVVAWRWAQLREAVAEAATRARELPARHATRTGYAGATRQLHIEHRARQVFVPRVA